MRVSWMEGHLRKPVCSSDARLLPESLYAAMHGTSRLLQLLRRGKRSQDRPLRKAVAGVSPQAGLPDLFG